MVSGVALACMVVAQEFTAKQAALDIITLLQAGCVAFCIPFFYVDSTETSYLFRRYSSVIVSFAIFVLVKLSIRRLTMPAGLVTLSLFISHFLFMYVQLQRFVSFFMSFYLIVPQLNPCLLFILLNSLVSAAILTFIHYEICHNPLYTESSGLFTFFKQVCPRVIRNSLSLTGYGIFFSSLLFLAHALAFRVILSPIELVFKMAPAPFPFITLFGCFFAAIFANFLFNFSTAILDCLITYNCSFLHTPTPVLPYSSNIDENRFYFHQICLIYKHPFSGSSAEPTRFAFLLDSIERFILQEFNNLLSILREMRQETLAYRSSTSVEIPQAQNSRVKKIESYGLLDIIYGHIRYKVSFVILPMRYSIANYYVLKTLEFIQRINNTDRRLKMLSFYSSADGRDRGLSVASLLDEILSTEKLCQIDLDSGKYKELVAALAQ